MNSTNQEPEELVGQALYLLQLIQQDLNFGRHTTCLARVSKAKELITSLESQFLTQFATAYEERD
jgi:hypothetical protein